MDNTYKIKIKLGDAEFEFESSDRQWLEAKEKEYLEKAQELQAARKAGSEPRMEETLPSNLTIAEFFRNYIKKSKISSRPDIATFFVYYLKRIAKKTTISTQDVVQCFADVAYSNYNNINMSDILNRAKSKAYLNNVRRDWSITLTGEDFVLNTISTTQQ